MNLFFYFKLYLYTHRFLSLIFFLEVSVYSDKYLINYLVSLEIILVSICKLMDKLPKSSVVGTRQRYLK